VRVRDEGETGRGTATCMCLRHVMRCRDDGGLNFVAHDHLRGRLVEMRDEMLSRMVRKGAVEPGHLPLIAGIAAALAGKLALPRLGSKIG
jgi:hypothetical protein